MSARWISIGLVLATFSTACGGSGDSSVDAGRDGAISDAITQDGTSVDANGACRLQVATINGTAVAQISQIGAADDKDPATLGIQIDVGVTAIGLADSSKVTLSVTRLSPAPQKAVVSGAVLFEGVTVASDLTQVLVSATAENCQRAQLSLPVQPAPECFFVSPADGAALTKGDDKNPNNNSFDYDVVVGTINAIGGSVELRVNNAVAGTASVGGNGQVTFADATLDVGSSVALSAKLTVGSVERTCASKISVSSDLPSCIVAFNPPAVPTSLGKDGLGVKNDTAPGTTGMQVRVGVTTTTLVDRVTLRVNGATVRTAAATGGSATITNLTLPEGTVEVQASCVETASGNTGTSVTHSLVVDSAVPEKVAQFACTVTNNRTGLVQCCLTAVKDGGSQGTGIEDYELRYSTTGALTDANWAAATKIATLPPKLAGQQICVDVKDLPLGADYHFGVRAADYVRNASGVAAPSSTPVDVDFTATQVKGVDAQSAFGSTFAVGDFNCDGSSDLAVGDKAANGGRGRVYLFFGNAGGFSGVPDRKLSGTVANAGFGARVSALANFNADGGNCDDLAVLANAGDPKARVYVYLGRSTFNDRDDLGTGTGAELVLKLADAAAATEGLSMIAGGGDFDNDGAGDLAITYKDTGAADTAEVWLVYGDKSLTAMSSGKAPLIKELPGAAGVRITDEKASSGFGDTLCTVRSLDGDKFAELIIGAKGWIDSAAGATRGSVYVVKGGNRGASLPESVKVDDARVIPIRGAASNAGFGRAVGVVGDMDGDGTVEFAASDTTVGGAAGEVYLFNLGGTVPATAADAKFVVKNNIAGAAGDAFGSSLACSTDTDSVDINKDGVADLLVGAAGQGSGTTGVIYQFNGQAGMSAPETAAPSYVFKAPSGSGTFGVQIDVANDADGDGFADVVAGDPTANSGRGYFLLFH
ncbi:MAG: FG-GAP repeat protein [Deltaproteobacteria bacterium]|nr:FG-GAP repeat protein [Deltaproteobacteria bacterium]